MKARPRGGERERGLWVVAARLGTEVRQHGYDLVSCEPLSQGNGVGAVVDCIRYEGEIVVLLGGRGSRFGESSAVAGGVGAQSIQGLDEGGKGSGVIRVIGQPERSPVDRVIWSCQV